MESALVITFAKNKNAKQSSQMQNCKKVFECSWTGEGGKEDKDGLHPSPIRF